MSSIKKICSDHRGIVLFYIAGVVSLVLFSLYIHFFWSTFDADIAGVIRQDRGKAFAAVMGFISWWGMSYVMIVSVFCASLLFFLASYKREAWFTLSVLVADIVNIFLKLIINRHRPDEVVIFPKFQQASFPSGHVVHYVVFFGFILAVMLFNSSIHKGLRGIVSLLCVFLIAGVSVARIYLGTHWATDIVAAYIVGFMMLGVVILLYLKDVDSKNSLKKGVGQY
ncbi:MAG: phosphatase PAP2 family protein [Candidatus Omnitrophica bacterium]|nr:phosphatase PAP2 family protein [Candidatus Omnitrophota bacterium]